MQKSTLTEKHKQTITELFLQGKRCYQISRIIKISDSSIRNFLVKEKLIVPRKREVVKYPVYKKLTESDMETEMKTIIYK